MIHDQRNLVELWLYLKFIMFEESLKKNVVVAGHVAQIEIYVPKFSCYNTSGMNRRIDFSRKNIC